MAALCSDLLKKPLDDTEIAKKVIANGGYDMHEVSVQDVIGFLNGDFSHCDREVCLWAFAETMYMYKYTDSAEELCCGIFTLIVLCILSRQNKDDFFNNFGKMIEMYNFFREKLEDISDLSIVLFYLCFSEQPQYPEMVFCHFGKLK